jgi:phospholipase C
MEAEEDFSNTTLIGAGMPRARTSFVAICIAAATTFAGCGGGGGAAVQPAVSPPTQTAQPRPTPVAQIKHVIVIVQENRTVDNLFQGFPGADTQSWGLDHLGRHVPLVPVALAAPFGVDHSYATFVTEFDGGRMDGFDNPAIRVPCDSPCGPHTPYSYVRQSDVKPYWTLALRYGLADEMLQSTEGDSFAAHQYLIAGQSGRPWAMASIPNVPTAGCNRPGARVSQMDLRQSYPGTLTNPTFPCKDYATIFDSLVAKGLTWRFYSPYPTYLYNAPFAIQHIYDGPMQSSDITPEIQIVDDIRAHALPSVAYLASRLDFSDHPRANGGKGPDWIATVTNAIGADPVYWKSTVVLVTWDDWGGLYDHVPPRHPDGAPSDPYEYGFRVPLLVVSAYLRVPHFVDHTPRDQTAIVHFIEDVFGLNSLGQLETKTDDLFGMFDFTRGPLPYAQVDTGGFTPQDVLRYPLRPGID